MPVDEYFLCGGRKSCGQRALPNCNLLKNSLLTETHGKTSIGFSWIKNGLEVIHSLI